MMLYGAGNAGMQYAASSGSMEQQQKYNVENMERQHQYTLDLMDKSYQMNSYSSQLDQLREAGLHPSLLLKDADFSAVGLGSSPLSSAPSPIAFDGVVDSALKASQLKAQNIDNSYAPVLQQKNLDLLDSQIKKLGIERDLSSWQLDLNWQISPYLVGKSAAELDEIRSRIALLDAQVETEGKQQQLFDDQHEINSWLKSEAEFKKSWLKLVGIPFDDDNVYNQLFGLAKNGDLSAVVGVVLDCATSIINGLAQSLDAASVGNPWFEGVRDILELLNRIGEFFDPRPSNKGSASAAW